MQSAAPDRRVYTDERFPFLEIVNYGGVKFDIFEKDDNTGAPLKIDDFVAYERPGMAETSQEFAHRRALLYYERMASGQGWTELLDRGAEDVPVHNLSAKVANPKAAYPLTGMREQTPQDIESVIAAARSEPDPQKAVALRQQAMSMMQQEESAAQKVARILLAL